MTLESITCFEVPLTLVRDTEEALREAGREGFELFVLWTGSVTGTVFIVEHVYVPKQRTYKLRRGVCVRVDSTELDRLNRWLYNHHQILGVQIHTHPEDAYHSQTDDRYPIVTLAGGLSIVVPDFCRAGMNVAGIAVFRLSRDGWILQQEHAASELVQVVA